ncbi:hypothetical protein NW758_011050 [Fusarium oxysporum]|nr:hypothetical protein NW758_011050 [Fusarium oxysporum]
MPECLAAICDLTSLEQLGLRCDERVPRFRSYEDYTEDTFPIWLIDHRNLQAHLQSLKNLRILTIRGDAYPPRMNEMFGHNPYYRQDMANAEDFQTARDHPELAPFVQGRGDSKLYWEHAHLYRMLEYARSYRKVLPKLEWILCGRRPMKFVENDQGLSSPIPSAGGRTSAKHSSGEFLALLPRSKQHTKKTKKQELFGVECRFHIIGSLSVLLQSVIGWPLFFRFL